MKKLRIYLFIIPHFAFIIHCNAQNILLQESFNTNTLPSGWGKDSVPNSNIGFRFLNLGVNSNGFHGYSAFVSSNGNGLTDCNLTTPVINASSLSSVYLGYAEQFDADLYPTNYSYDIQKIDVSNDSGATWINVLDNSYYHGLPVPTRNVVNITQQAAGHSKVKIRFHYIDQDAGYSWAIDSVVVADSIPCTPGDSGQALASTKFACTGGAVNLLLKALSNGIGISYQWEYNNTSTGNAWQNIPGAVYDTASFNQNGPSYYRCQVTCQSQTFASAPYFLTDTPTIYPYSYSLHQDLICPFKNDTLKLRQPYAGQYVTYQWQYGNNFWGPYIDIPSATDSMYAVTYATWAGTKYWFRCMRGCSTSAAQNPTYPFLEMNNPNPMCYCLCKIGDNCSLNDDYLSNVSIISTAMNVNDSCVDTLNWSYGGNYVFYTPTTSSNTATLKPGSTYTLSVTRSQDGEVLFWMDYNRNGFFDSTEFIDLGFATANVPLTYNFAVPSNASIGQTGMRVKGFWGFYNILSDACSDSVDIAMVKDFAVTIDTATGIKYTVQEILSVELFPNPAEKELIIKNEQLIIKNVEIENVVGEAVFNLRTPNSRLLTKINVSSLAPGIYFVKVTTDRGSVVRKFIKQ